MVSSSFQLQNFLMMLLVLRRFLQLQTHLQNFAATLSSTTAVGQPLLFVGEEQKMIQCMPFTEKIKNSG